ncbi:S-adenosyl-L-methionine-dependent methyltransferase [Coniochaeta sp. PMI_546]|nr:S-adenosyl-L-methionine-dependent methyltransferase [Coniochaeta sp. PMI_546]
MSDEKLDHPPISPQAQLAIQTYSPRAASYDESWHPDYSRRLTRLIPFREGDSVLSLCCGTGLDLLRAAEAIGPSGLAVGVDVCGSMLAVARESLACLDLERRSPGEKMGQVVLVLGDVTDLGSVLVPENGFDVIICSNAFALLPNPASTLRHWRDFLKPGGLLVVDIPHEKNMRSGFMTAAEMFGDMLRREGYGVEKVVGMEKVVGRREVYYSKEDADGQFEYLVKSDGANWARILEQGGEEKVREVFREEVERSAGDDGQVEVVEENWVFFARRSD